MAKSSRKPAAKSSRKPAKSANGKKKSRPASPAKIQVNGAPIEFDPIVEAAYQRALKESKQPLPKEMSLSQAADYLDVTHLSLFKLIKRGELPCHLVGKRRRIPTDSLRQYREKLCEKAKAAAHEVTRLSQEMGYFDDEGNPLIRNPQ